MNSHQNVNNVIGRRIPFFFRFRVEFEFSTTNMYYPHNTTLRIRIRIRIRIFYAPNDYHCGKNSGDILFMKNKKRVAKQCNPVLVKVTFLMCISSERCDGQFWVVRFGAYLFWVPRFPNVTPHNIVMRFSIFIHSSDSCCCFLFFKVAPHPTWSPPQGLN